MGAIFGVAWSLMFTVGGAAVAAAAPFGAAGMGGQYLAGHVLLGLGLGQLGALLVRAAVRLGFRRLRAGSAATTARAGEAVPSWSPADTAPIAGVSVLPVRPAASMAPLRGRHAA